MQKESGEDTSDVDSDENSDLLGNLISKERLQRIKESGLCRQGVIPPREHQGAAERAIPPASHRQDHGERQQGEGADGSARELRNGHPH